MAVITIMEGFKIIDKAQAEERQQKERMRRTKEKRKQHNEKVLTKWKKEGA